MVYPIGYMGLFFRIFVLLLCGVCCGIGSLSLEEMVGQLFMVYFEGEEINEEARRLFEEAKVGGIILYSWANGLSEVKQTRELCAGLQKASSIPLLIGIDQEGGRVSRLCGEFPQFPGNGDLGRSGNPELAYEAARGIGIQLKDVGITCNFAPVVDINSNPNNPIIGVRSFGNTPEMVTQFGKRSLEGYQSVGVIPCLKHFPGHGDVTVDPHFDLPVVSKSLTQLMDMELYPFRMLAKRTPMIMTSHILFPKIDPTYCATLSPLFVTDILRKELRFEGVIVTDSLVMKGVLRGSHSLEDVVFQAIEAGNDILLIGGRDLIHKREGETHVDEVVKVYKSVLDGVKKGKISEERIKQSADRILLLKERAGLFGRVD